MMGGSLPTEQKLYGLFVMNEEGTVLYSRLETEGATGEECGSMVGQNFFADIVAGRFWLARRESDAGI